MEGRGFNSRYIILISLVGILILACVIRLFDLQVVKGETYRQQAEQRLVRAYPVKAPRGEIVDRYGSAFVENRMGYAIQFQKIEISDDALNEEILAVSHLVIEGEGTLESDFPIFYDEKNKAWGFTYTEGKEQQDQVKKAASDKKTAQEAKEAEEEDIDADAAATLKAQQEEKLEAWKKENKLTDYQSAQQIMDYYRSKFAVAGKYTDQEALTIVSVRYDMVKSSFSANNPYIMARDVDAVVVQQIKERAMDFPGVEVEIEPIRVFAHGSMAAHILGRTGKIYAEEYQELKEKGYGMNDIIGKDGLEKVLEPYLKGKDGYKSVSMSRDGGVTEILQSQAVEPGNYAKLTLDMELQSAMEKSLEKNITEAVNRNGAGGAIAIVPNTGEVLAMASYPSYDPAAFDTDYEKLVQAKSKPLFNRVLSGTYSPGSTFKPLTAIAGLESGVIQPDTHILDRGRYTYYPSYQPTCLIYSSTGATHGNIEVSEALGVSCNYFFYEVGRLTGIENLDKYASYFGLGESTGIELAESKGLMASPQHREEIGAQWYPGDVIQAAIGQSDNLFTPAQLANYIATLLNKGKRYRLHLVNEVVDYDTDEVVYRKNPEVLADNPIADSTFDKVTNGMRQVVTSGTARSAFSTSKYKAAGKTGTAEVPDGADNVLFVGFAPYENPEIVVAVVIEHGASSSYAAKVARDVFDAYMELKEERADPEAAAKKKKAGEEDPDSTQKPKAAGTGSAKPASSTAKPKATSSAGRDGGKQSAAPTASAERGKPPTETSVPNTGGSAAGDGTL